MYSNLIKSLLRPILRFCLSNSIYFQEICEVVKSLLIELAIDEIKTYQKEATPSKISALTGITRREINRNVNLEPLGHISSPSVISRIIGKWRNDINYLDPAGDPKILQADTKNSEFSALVKSISQDLNPYTVRFELERLSLIESVEGGLKLLGNIVVAKGEAEQSFNILASDISDLLISVTENTFKNDNIKNLHLRTEFDNISPSKAQDAKVWLLKEGTLFQNKVRDYLSKLDMDYNDHGDKGQGVRICVGSYSTIENSLSTVSINKLHN